MDRTCGHVYTIPLTARFAQRPHASDRKRLRLEDQPGMATTDIVIRGAREHNLRDVSLDLPRGTLICFTGRLGLGQELAGLRHALCRGAAALRREPLELRPPVPGPDAQARGRPDRRPEPVDLDPAEDRRAEPAVAPSARSPRSTTTSASSSPASARGTARTATGRSPPRPASRSSRGSSSCPPGRRFSVLAPVVRGQKGEYKDLFAELGRAGYVRARVNGQVVTLTDDLSLDRQIKHNIEVVIDRLKAGPGGPAAAGRGGRAGARSSARGR